jgi:hypothetical protein
MLAERIVEGRAAMIGTTSTSRRVPVTAVTTSQNTHEAE